MSTLFLIRHSQASFLQENYDQLSPLGQQQSRVLGQYWAAKKLKFDRVATGPRVRQKHTAQIIQQAYQAANGSFPNPEELPEFDEYDAETVLKQALPLLLQSDESIAKLQAVFKSSSTNLEQRASFQKLFEVVIAKWVRAEISVPGVETWREFKSRVNSGLKKFLSAGQRGETVAVFTSGGPIAIAMQRALDLSDEAALGVSWMSQNSSWSEFLYGADRFTLGTFNSRPHLEDPAMRTYR